MKLKSRVIKVSCKFPQYVEESPNFINSTASIIKIGSISV